jgi:hypothetical protein
MTFARSFVGSLILLTSCGTGTTSSPRPGWSSVRKSRKPNAKHPSIVVAPLLLRLPIARPSARSRTNVTPLSALDRLSTTPTRVPPV